MKILHKMLLMNGSALVYMRAYLPMRS